MVGWWRPSCADRRCGAGELGAALEGLRAAAAARLEPLQARARRAVERRLQALCAEADQHLTVDLDGRHAAPRVELPLSQARGAIALDIVFGGPNVLLCQVAAKLAACRAPGRVVDGHVHTLAQGGQLARLGVTA